VGQFIENLQYKIKTSSGSILLASYRVFVGFVIGLTISLVGQIMIGYGTFSFLLVIVSMTVAFYKVTRAWKWAHILVFSLVCVLLVMLLRMYILIAPGA